jgi:hypothetical protein
MYHAYTINLDLFSFVGIPRQMSIIKLTEEINTTFRHIMMRPVKAKKSMENLIEMIFKNSYFEINRQATLHLNKPM